MQAGNLKFSSCPSAFLRWPEVMGTVNGEDGRLSTRPIASTQNSRVLDGTAFSFGTMFLADRRCAWMRKGADTRAASAVWLRSTVRISFGRIRLKLQSWLLHDSELWGGSTYAVLPLLESDQPLWPPVFPSLQSKRKSLSDWRMQLILFRISYRAGALSGFSRTAMLTYDPIEIRLGQHSSTGRTKRLAYQHLNDFSQANFYVIHTQ